MTENCLTRWGVIQEPHRRGAHPPAPPAHFRRGKTMAKDPVCGMQVDEKKAAATSTYKGTTYYFCAPGCKVAFDKSPEKFLAKAKS